MKLYVLKYKDVSYENDFPPEYPAEVRRQPEYSANPGGKWILMTEQELNDLMETHQAEFNDWMANHYPPLESGEGVTGNE
jgi:hypothetical protein